MKSRRGITGRGSLGAHLVMVLCIDWLAVGLRFDLRLTDAVRGALRLASCRGRNTSRLGPSRCRCGELTGGGLGVRRKLASRLIAAGALSCTGDMWPLTHNALGRTLVVVRGVGKSTFDAAWSYLGAGTHVLAMPRPPACGTSLRFSAKGPAAVSRGAVSDPKWNPSAMK